MKFILVPLMLLSAITYASATTVVQEKEKTGPVIKEVCHPKKDKNGKELKDKNGKTLQECKKIKVHKKLEGKEVPGQKK